MTEVTFHYNAPDKLAYTCRVAQVVAGKGNRVVVVGDSELLGRLDVQMWTFDELSFLPHCRASEAGEDVLAATPIVLAESARGAPHHEILFNLGGRVPEGFERFERLVEVVTTEDEDRALGRARIKHYKDRGYSVRLYDVVTKEMR